MKLCSKTEVRGRVGGGISGVQPRLRTRAHVMRRLGNYCAEGRRVLKFRGRPLLRPRNRWDENIEVDFKEIG